MYQDNSKIISKILSHKAKKVFGLLLKSGRQTERAAALRCPTIFLLVHRNKRKPTGFSLSPSPLPRLSPYSNKMLGGKGQRQAFWACLVAVALLQCSLLVGAHSHSHSLQHQHEHEHKHKKGGHECVHHDKVAPLLRERSKAYESTETFFQVDTAELGQVKAQRRQLLSETNQRPLKVHLEYQLGSLQQDKKDHIQNSIMPVAVSVLQQYVSAKTPVTGKLLMARQCSSYWDTEPYLCYQVSDIGQCLDATHNSAFFGAYKECSTHQEGSCTTYPAGDGVTDQDIILYVTAANSETCGGMTIAYAGWCELDPYTKRPIAGAINFCPDRINTDAEGFGDMLDTSIHEIIHVLAFTDSLYGHYVDENGQTRGMNSVVRQTTVDASTNKLSLITPKVVEAARQHFQCDDVSQVSLENEGGDSTAHSHWEELHYEGEIMCGKQSGRAPLTNLTLGLLDDSGWYQIDYTKSGFLQYGHNAGCMFPGLSCLGLTAAFPRYHCTAQEKEISQCTADHYAFGYCTDSNLGNTCTTVKAYENGHCTDSSFHSASRARFGESHALFSRCFEAPDDTIEVKEGNLVYSSTIQGAGCYQTSCAKVNGQHVLSIGISGVFRECPQGQYVNLADFNSNFRSGRIGPCPNADHICPYFGCKNDCSNRGRCNEGKCHCYLGYEGDDCSSITSGNPDTSPAPAPTPTPTPTPSPSTPTTPAPSTPSPSPAPEPEPEVKIYTPSYRCFDGYLMNCAIFFDDGGITERNVTSSTGVGVLTYNGTYDKTDKLVKVTGSGSNTTMQCKDSFTNLTIPFEFVSRLEASMVSPLTTLAVHLMVEGGMIDDTASEKISTLANLPKGEDIFSYDPIVAASRTGGDKNGFAFTSKLTSTINLFAEYYSMEQTLTKEEAATKTFKALAQILNSAAPANSLSSESDLNALLNKVDSVANIDNTGASSKARTSMVKAVSATNMLYDSVLVDENATSPDAFFTRVVQASIFSQSSMATQINKLTSTQTDEERGEVDAYVLTVSWDNPDLFEEVEVNYGVHYEKSTSEKISDILGILEENLLYIAIGGGVLFLGVVFSVATKLARNRSQIVKDYPGEYA